MEGKVEGKREEGWALRRSGLVRERDFRSRIIGEENEGQ